MRKLCIFATNYYRDFGVCQLGESEEIRMQIFLHLITILCTIILSHLYQQQITNIVNSFSSTTSLLPRPLHQHQLQEQLGEHILVEIKSAPFNQLSNKGDLDLLNNLVDLKKATLEILTAANLTVVEIVGHQFAPQGISVVAVLAESHLSIHTWPELGYAALDVYTCGLEIKGRAKLAAQGIVKYLKAEEHHMSIVSRGIPLPDYLIQQQQSQSQHPNTNL